MPGVFGAVKSVGGRRNIAELMTRMADSMSNGVTRNIDSFVDDEVGYGIGRVSLGILNPVEQPVEKHEHRCKIVFHGEIYGEESGGRDPEYVLDCYLTSGDNCASALKGIFHFVIYDGRTNELKLFSDKFGLQPLYYAILPGGVVFGGEVKSLLQDAEVGTEPDFRSFGDFFHYGQIIGTKTLFKEVKLIEAGSVFSINLSSLKVSSKKYWHLNELFVRGGDYRLDLPIEDVTDRLMGSIQACSSKREILGLSLSGGLDSRGILAGLGGSTKGLSTYTLGLRGCADQKLAEMMARAAETSHEFIEIENDYLSDFIGMAKSMIRISDGMYHPHESTEMIALEYFKRAKFKILLRGHGGEIAKAALAYPVMVTPQVYSCSSREILNHIYGITNLVKRDIDVAKLFSPQICHTISESPFKSLEEACGNAAETMAPADVCIYYYISQHIRRQVVSSLDIFRTQVEIRMPYVDEEFLRGLLQLPLKYRNSGEIHYALIKKYMPDLIKIPNSNTGAPLDAGPVKLFIMDKINSALKRIGVSGFRHYNEFQKWHRESFRECSRKIIFSDITRDRGIYNLDYLDILFDLHMTGKKDYGHLIGTIVGLELWFRSFVD